MCLAVNRLIYVVLLVAAPSLPVFSQTGSASLQGTVRDPSGAVLPAAKVRISNLSTGIQHESVSNSAGFYALQSLVSGDYRIEVTTPGMETWQGRATLQVGQTAQIDPVLKLASSATEITVVGDVTPLVNTTTPTLANVLERARVEQLPLNGRILQDLVLLTTPGLEGGSRFPRVYGLREAAMEYLQDGAVLSDRNTGRMMERPPGIDTIQEFRVETSVPSAKYSRPASAIVSTRNGTNEWHGSLFYTGRNNGFGVGRRRQDFFAKPPQLIRNEYGGSLGGPVILPKLYNGRNRTFFFFAREDFRLRSANTIGARMPSMSMREGDFSGLIDSAGRQLVLYDPWTTDVQTRTRMPFPGNRLPIQRRSPLAAYIYSVTPAPTITNINPVVAANYFGPAPQNDDQATHTIRLDHRVRDGDLLFARVSVGGFDQVRRRGNEGPTPITSDKLFNYEFLQDSNANATLSWTHTFSPRFFVETIATGSRNMYRYNTTAPGNDEDIAAKLGLPNPFHRSAAPQLSNLGLDSNYQGSLPRDSDSRVLSGEQNYSYVLSNHQFEFGWRYRREVVGKLPDSPSQSVLNFNSFATSLYDPSTGQSFGAVPRTGDDSANFFLGVAASYSQQIATRNFHQRSSEVSSYLQDNWKITSRLTVNLGLRYEYFAPWLDKEGLFSTFDLNTKTIVRRIGIDEMIRRGETTVAIVNAFAAIGAGVTTPEKAGLPSNFVTSSKLDFSPRAGFAYRLNPSGHTMVLRGGYGVYHFGIPARVMQNMSGTNPPLRGSLSYSLNSAAQTPDGLPNLGIRSVPTVIAGANSKDLLDSNRADSISRGVSLLAFQPGELPTATAHEWNLSLDTEVMRNTVLRVSYVGTAGRNTDNSDVLNGQPNDYVWFTRTGLPLPTGTFAPVARRTLDKETYGNIQFYRKTGFSNFHGAQIEVQRRFSQGLAFQFFYVLSNAFSTGNPPSEGGNFNINSVYEPELFLPGAVPADYDQRNRFLNYQRDPEIAKHRVRWNLLAELPLGRGKKWMGNAGPWLNRLVGGWQLAAYSSVFSRYWNLPTGNWGSLNEIEIYGTKYKIEDCRSGTCIQGYLYYNGYIPANRINSRDAQGRPNGVMGVPSNYRPAHQPIYPTPANGGSSSDPNFSQYETNSVFVRLNNGNQQRVALDTNLHPWRNQRLPGPWNFDLSGSLFKEIPLRERLHLRLNMDFFNALNSPGIQLPDVNSGILSLQNSQNAARQLQWTLRVIW